MKVAILGSGPAGATLYKILKDRYQVQVDLFGRTNPTTCGLRSCAWGVNRPKFKNLCNSLGLEMERYCTSYHKYFQIWNLKTPCDITMINKILLLEDLTGGNVLYGQPEVDKYDRIINATGLTDGKFYTTFQVKVEGKFPLRVIPKIFPKPHCVWYFPLSDNVTHIGVLSLSDTLEDPSLNLNGHIKICQCYSKIHRGGLVKSLIEGNVWKVGESAGIVDPITGSGILASMNSAILLFESWNSPKGYKEAMVSTFSYTTNRLKALFHNEFRGLPIGLIRR